jgi:endonuclease/exonuclease/phosphatase family metal-dependent hydrolase
MKRTISFLVILLLLGCVPIQETETSLPVQEITPDVDGTIKIATFNIQVFGDKKVANQEVLEILTILACEFDVIAIQEIRDKEGTSIIDYVNNINSVCESDGYDYVTSERLGRTVSKEQYGFIYNTERAVLVSTKQYPDTYDVFEREPFFVQFETGEYAFTLGNFHIKPDDVKGEMDAISDVYEYMGDYYDKAAMVFLGDFNADCNYFDEDEETFLDRFYWVVDDNTDTTVGATECAYDRIILTEGIKNRFNGMWGVFRFDEVLELDIDKTEVSDHYPVWFELEV